MSFVEEHHRQSLKDHFLELHVETDNLTAWYLRDGKHPKSRMMSTLILFTVEGIVIMGDLCPGQNGVISCLGYGQEWFSERNSERYLCEKFLRKEFVSEVAYHALRRRILEARREGYWSKEKAREIWERNEYHQPNKGEEWNGYEFYELYSDHNLDYDGEGYDYEPGEAGWLCALQQKFAELFPARLNVVKEDVYL